MIRVLNTETGAEFGLDVDSFTHGVSSYRIGQARDNPFLDSDQKLSWDCGWRYAEHLSARVP